MAKKRCHEHKPPCTKAPRCDHAWHVWARYKGEVERGPVEKYAFLLDPHQRVPETKAEADELEGRVKTWLVKGRPTPTPPEGGGGQPPAIKTTTKTVAKVVADYNHDHASKLAGNGVQSILNRIVREFGNEPYTALFDRRTLKDFLADILEEGRERESTNPNCNYNAHFKRWKHMTEWLVIEDQLHAMPLPFYDKLKNPHGIRRATEVDRTRRFRDDEEARIIRACQTIDDGGMMLGRFFIATDTGIRKGEMLNLERAAILSDHQGKGLTLHVRWMTNKTRKERFVPVTTDRSRAFLKTRRFAPFPFGQLDGTRISQFRAEWDQVRERADLIGWHYESVKEATADDHGYRRIIDFDEDFHWHDIRHECGSRLADRNVPLTDIKELLGHARLETTQKYLNSKFTNLADNMRAVAVKMGI